MGRYIDADKLIESICHTADLGGWIGDTLRNIKRLAVRYINSAPSIDIVRCKECKHRPIKEDADGADHGFNIIAPNEAERCPCLVEDGWYSWMPNDDFYCGYGEREGE